MKHFLLILLFCPLITIAQLKVAKLFSDHMVLQRNKPIKIWGTATPGDEIHVSLNKQSVGTICNANGEWVVAMNSEPAGGPFSLIVKSRQKTFHFQDVLIGDVWLCAGQSNMEWTVANSKLAAQEIAAANFPKIRHLKIANSASLKPLTEIETVSGWQWANPTHVPDFSAVGYFFARTVFLKTGIPIGLINCSWGGTMIETWMSKSTLDTMTDFKSIASELPTDQASFAKAMRKNLDNRLEKLPSGDANEPATNWHQRWYNDSAWSTLAVPTLWENQGLDNVDGVMWYRTRFYLNAEDVKKEIVLSLGKIDDGDTTFLNGEKIGNLFKYDLPRRYLLPKNLIRIGENVLAVKVIDTGGGGGFWGDAAAIRLEVGSQFRSLAGNWKAKFDRSHLSENLTPNSMPTLAYNGMIHPILNAGLAGILWYQGESNAARAVQYEATFKALIRNWRSDFRQGLLPFYFVQLASFNAGDSTAITGSQWAELRHSQWMALQLPNTGMAVTTDIGEAKDIHPKNKQEVGKRLALWALKFNHNQTQVEATGPLFKAAREAGFAMQVSFVGAAKGLAIRKGESELRGFTVAGPDQKFYIAKAKIVGDYVVAWSDRVPKPVAVRYAWTDVTDKANLVNSVGLPASPFRTDNWVLRTQHNRYSF